MDLELAAGVAVKLASDDVAAIGGSVVDALSGSAANPLHLVRTGVTLGASPQIIDLGSPPTGRLWNLLYICLLGTDAFTALAPGAVAVCVGDPANFGVSSVRIPAMSVPQMRTVDSGMWVRSQENLFVLTNAIVSTTQSVIATVELEEWREADVTMNNPGFTQVR
jgi:hypothetical protein